MHDNRRSTGDRATPSAVRDRLRDAVDPLDRTETLPVSTAVGRPLADAVTARRPVPHYDQAAVDGFAARAADIAGEDGGRTTVSIGDGVGPEAAARVDAGDPLPAGADAVVPLDTATVHGDEDGTPTVEISAAESVEPGTGVRAEGADVAAGETVLAAGQRLRASDPALCTAVGRTRVEAVQRPTVGVVPTGDDLVGGDPERGEVVETDGTTVSEFVERWGGKVTYRDPVESDPHALRAAVERDLTKDLLVTVGGTGAGERDRIADVVADLGEVPVDGVALEPGGTTAFGVVRERPVLSLPGDPVAAFVATAEFVRPAVARLAGRDPPAPATTDAELAAAVDSQSGRASVVPVAFEDESRAVRPVRDEPLSALARADGWVTVPVDRDGVPAGETVSVERWEGYP